MKPKVLNPPPGENIVKEVRPERREIPALASMQSESELVGKKTTAGSSESFTNVVFLTSD